MDQSKIGCFLAQLRREKGLTQEQLGVLLGVTNKTVSRWETGRYLPDLSMLELLSAQFDVTISELVAGERLDDAALRRSSNALLIRAARNEAFSLREKAVFWRRKWLHEHWMQLMLLLLAAAGYAAVLLLPLFCGTWRPLMSALWSIVCLAGYGWTRNRIAAYIEDKLYGPVSQPKSNALPALPGGRSVSYLQARHRKVTARALVQASSVR